MGGVEGDGMGVQIPFSSDPPTGEGDDPMDGQVKTATAANGQAPVQDEQDQRSEGLIEEGALSKAASCLQSFGVAPASPATFRKVAGMFLRRAHPLLLQGLPQSDSQSQSSGSQSPLLTLSHDNLLEAIRSVPKGSTQGVMGWRYEHLSYFLPKDGSAQARILRIATCLARGDAPVGFISLLVGDRCFALNKNARGTEVRPILVGDVLRRWVTRAILLEFGFRLCGAASGTTEYQSAHFDKKLKEARELNQAVEEYGDPQGAHLLFRFCILPKLIYLTRIIGDVIVLGECSQADRELSESWARIIGMMEEEWAHGEVKGAFTQILRGLRHTHVLEETTFGHLGVATDSRLTKKRNKQVDLFASLSNGDTLLADVSVTFPISSDASRLRTRSKTAGAVAKTKSKEKVWKYAVAARAVGLRFVPLVFETFGRPDRETVSFIKELVSVASSRAGFSTEGKDEKEKERSPSAALNATMEGLTDAEKILDALEAKSSSLRLGALVKLQHLVAYPAGAAEFDKHQETLLTSIGSMLKGKDASEVTEACRALGICLLTVAEEGVSMGLYEHLQKSLALLVQRHKQAAVRTSAARCLGLLALVGCGDDVASEETESLLVTLVETAIHPTTGALKRRGSDSANGEVSGSYSSSSSNASSSSSSDGVALVACASLESLCMLLSRRDHRILASLYGRARQTGSLTDLPGRIWTVTQGALKTRKGPLLKAALKVILLVVEAKWRARPSMGADHWESPLCVETLLSDAERGLRDKTRERERARERADSSSSLPEVSEDLGSLYFGSEKKEKGGAEGAVANGVQGERWLQNLMEGLQKEYQKEVWDLGKTVEEAAETGTVTPMQIVLGDRREVLVLRSAVSVVRFLFIKEVVKGAVVAHLAGRDSLVARWVRADDMRGCGNPSFTHTEEQNHKDVSKSDRKAVERARDIGRKRDRQMKFFQLAAEEGLGEGAFGVALAGEGKGGGAAAAEKENTKSVVPGETTGGVPHETSRKSLEKVMTNGT
uniref:Interferon-related developmental regulator N-terminal domain-containing protein n=1 Tax=Chromera velia CCMP2878 TaxID=1169474 RepID=A0A0G4GKM2_9ALVE|eukprot:Cvel_22333.t1-p1 / transcript=Cvel_22333.t1 / gene=Cvel_22333 / organism=Chromera_velia_CCMP2878 / gene_product=hypothetical protein / transcript_product=hypothetical protein / location=Cvel_scaffold2185:11827-26536(-) / protein_length=1008 / sequence_SO=supercontig / SO=protein_coding / is_pseudo=false